jgi:hypothetical protein
MGQTPCTYQRLGDPCVKNRRERKMVKSVHADIFVLILCVAEIYEGI